MTFQGLKKQLYGQSHDGHVGLSTKLKLSAGLDKIAYDRLNVCKLPVQCWPNDKF